MTKPPELAHLGSALRNIRLRAGFRYGKDIARAAGLTPSQVSLWETGTQVPNLANLLRYLRACRATLTTLDQEIATLGK